MEALGRQGEIDMDQGLAVVIGMSVSYIFSLAGLACAWIYYKKNKDRKSGSKDQSSRG